MVSCQIISEDDFPIEEMATISPVKISQREIIKLPRGGYIINTYCGQIQFGMPPETIKDSLGQGLNVPSYYIVPTYLFDKIYCMSIAEFEFPAQSIPNIQKEMEYFAKDPFNKNEPLTLDSLINFNIFDEKSNIAQLPKNVQVRKDNKRFVIIEDGEEIATFKDYIKIKVPGHEDYAVSRCGILRGTLIQQQNSKTNVYVEQNMSKTFFNPPIFGITVLGGSHGFDPKGSTSGYVIWINCRGIMVDPPIFATSDLKKQGVPSRVIDWVIVTHCHADHDAGIFQKILDSNKVEIITTPTIYRSFLRKYCAITDMTEDELSSLFTFRPVVIGAPLTLNGGIFKFYYSLHTIPCLGFTCEFQGKSIYFSGDTFYDPVTMNDMIQNGVISKERYETLVQNKWNHDIIIHEAGVPPIHTPVKVLNDLSPQIKQKLFLVHCAEKDIPKNSGLNQAKTGLQNTIILQVQQNPTMELFRKLDILSSLELLEKANVKNVRDLLQSATELKYNKNEYICKEGEIGNEFFIIISGVIKIYSNTKGKEFERFCYSGDYFGESALFAQDTRMATAVTVTPVELLIIKRNDFQFIFGQNSQITKNLSALIESRKSKALNTLAKNIFFSSLTSSQKIQLESILQEIKIFIICQISKNEIIWKINEQCNKVILISSGELQFFDCPDEKVQLDVGSFICDITQLQSNGQYKNNLKASQDSVIFIIKKKKFVQFLNQNPGLKILLSKVKYIL